MVNGPHAPCDDIAATDRIRRTSELWTDLLLGHLVARYGLGELAFDEERSLDFGSEHLASGLAERGGPVRAMILCGLRRGFPDDRPVSPARGEYHRRITQAVLAVLPQRMSEWEAPLRSPAGGANGADGTDTVGQPVSRPAEVRSAGSASGGLPSIGSAGRGIRFGRLRRR
jgi:hypothetical protein